MRRILVCLLGLFLLTVGFGLPAAPVMAEDANPQAIVDLVNNAVQLIVDKGEEDAFALLTDPNGEWVSGDLYVFVYDLSGTIKAHLNKKLEGKNLMNLKDVKGKVFAAEFVSIAKSEQGEGWCEYYWPKPNEKEASPKVSFIKRVPGKDLLVGLGVYDLTLDDARKATGIQ